MTEGTPAQTREGAAHGPAIRTRRVLLYGCFLPHARSLARPRLWFGTNVAEQSLALNTLAESGRDGRGRGSGITWPGIPNRMPRQNEETLGDII